MHVHIYTHIARYITDARTCINSNWSSKTSVSFYLSSESSLYKLLKKKSFKMFSFFIGDWNIRCIIFEYNNWLGNVHFLRAKVAYFYRVNFLTLRKKIIKFLHGREDLADLYRGPLHYKRVSNIVKYYLVSRSERVIKEDIVLLVERESARGGPGGIISLT